VPFKKKNRRSRLQTREILKIFKPKRSAKETLKPVTTRLGAPLHIRAR
jgi:hypothetical protein